MNKTYLTFFLLILLSQMLFWGCSDGENRADKSSRFVSYTAATADEKAILEMHDTYVKAWLENDEQTVMGLMEPGSRIQPSALCPVEGEDKIREFWFPKDGSTTTINRFETEILGTYIKDSLGTTLHNSLLDWSYEKDSMSMNMIQKGIATTVYRRQADGIWKIWRQMWTDIYAKQY